MKYWEIVADKLSAAGWSWGCVALGSRIAVHNRALELRCEPSTLPERRWSPLRAHTVNFIEGQQNCQKNLLSDSGRNALVLNYVTKRS